MFKKLINRNVLKEQDERERLSNLLKSTGITRDFYNKKKRIHALNSFYYYAKLERPTVTPMLLNR